MVVVVVVVVVIGKLSSSTTLACRSRSSGSVTAPPGKTTQLIARSRVSVDVKGAVTRQCVSCKAQIRATRTGGSLTEAMCFAVMSTAVASEEPVEIGRAHV